MVGYKYTIEEKQDGILIGWKWNREGKWESEWFYDTHPFLASVPPLAVDRAEQVHGTVSLEVNKR